MGIRRWGRQTACSSLLPAPGLPALEYPLEARQLPDLARHRLAHGGRHRELDAAQFGLQREAHARGGTLGRELIAPLGADGAGRRAKADPALRLLFGGLDVRVDPPAPLA